MKVSQWLFALLLAAGTVNAGLSDGLIAHYPFDGDANESTGQYINGILNGNALFKEGVVEQALYLDGNGSYVSIGNRLDLYNTYSVSFWINPDDLSRGNAGILAKYETNGYGPYDFYLCYDKVCFWISDGRGGAIYDNSNANIKANTWNLISYVANNNMLNIYINGNLDIFLDIPAMTQNNDKVTIGRQSLMFGNHSDLEFKGYIDDIRVYNRALSASEIQQLYKQEISPASPIIGGSVANTGLKNVICKNVTTGQSVTLKNLNGTNSWDCAAAGLLTRPGEIIKETLTGIIKTP